MLHDRSDDAVKGKAESTRRPDSHGKHLLSGRSGNRDLLIGDVRAVEG